MIGKIVAILFAGLSFVLTFILGKKKGVDKAQASAEAEIHEVREQAKQSEAKAEQAEKKAETAVSVAQTVSRISEVRANIVSLAELREAVTEDNYLDMANAQAQEAQELTGR